MYRSISTVKADAARRSYDAFGEGITWVVVNSGIDASHKHFQTHDTLDDHVTELHRDFTQSGDQRQSALVDESGYGSQIAGIIAGGLPPDLPEDQLRIFENYVDPHGSRKWEAKSLQPELISGIAPKCKLISLRVLDDKGRGAASNTIAALQHIQRDLIGPAGRLRVQGVDLSLSFEFDPSDFACGSSPICQAVDRLVDAGVVVVVAAGSTGYGKLPGTSEAADAGRLMTISDPGNAELAITVGSTHRDMPHLYGVSYFSSKGPTLDGRLKPDLVAPGEMVVSCASGRRSKWLRTHQDEGLSNDHILYAQDSHTGIASAHVSGAIAAFLSVHREFIGRPGDVKRIFLESATSLGRRPEFQGHGLVDLMRALHSV